MPTKKQKPEEETKALVKKGSTAVAVSSGAKQMMQDAQHDQSDFQQGDLAIPFLKVLQDTSPQCKKKDAAYVKGAESGLIMNTVTQAVYEHISVIVCAYEKHFVEWRPYDDGGGFIGVHARDSKLVENTPPNSERKRITKNRTELVETACFYVLYYCEHTQDWMCATIAMSSTALAKARKWATQIGQLRLKDDKGRSFTPPLYAFLWQLDGSAHQENDLGSWESWCFDRGDLVLNQEDGDALYDRAKAFRQAVKAQSVSTDFSKMDRGTGSTHHDDNVEEVL